MVDIGWNQRTGCNSELNRQLQNLTVDLIAELGNMPVCSRVAFRQADQFCIVSNEMLEAISITDAVMAPQSADSGLMLLQAAYCTSSCHPFAKGSQHWYNLAAT